MRPPVKFDHPPVVEVACGVVFAGLELQTAHIGAFWQRVKSEFPRIEDVAPLPPISEDSSAPSVELGWIEVPPLRRVWMLNDDGSNVIQVQQDRFLFNWKRTLRNEKYPSYHEVISRFDAYLGLFLAFLDEVGVVRPKYRQYELTYVNQVTTANGLDIVGLNALLVDHVRSNSPNRFLGEPDGFSWTTSYSLPDGGGRLHIVAQSPTNRSAKESIVRIDLAARGIPSDPSETGRRPWFDMAHHWITQGFVDVTSTVLHNEIWKRTS